MYALLTLVAIVLPMSSVLGALLLVRYWETHDGRRSPLTEKLLHGPGQQLRRELEKSDERMDTVFIVLILSGPLLLSTWALPQVVWAKVSLGPAEWAFFFVFVAAVLWAVYRSIGLRAKRVRLREGLNAELMTAQLLLPLAGKGCQIFHDIPADGFNLDHVVIGPYAVFMVETKSRKKPGQGKQSAQVKYDGKALHFPDHVSSKPVDQARSEADWLKKFLHGAAGETVPVVPVVALPGWYVTYGPEANRSDVIVLNPKMHGKFIDQGNGTALSQSLRNRIAYALVQRYPALP
jgi:hypothetical protein